MTLEIFAMVTCVLSAVFCGYCARDKFKQWRSLAALKPGSAVETSRGANGVIEEISDGLVTVLCTRTGPRSKWEEGEVYATFLSDARKNVLHGRWKVTPGQPPRLDPDLFTRKWDKTKA